MSRDRREDKQRSLERENSRKSKRTDLDSVEPSLKKSSKVIKNNSCPKCGHEVKIINLGIKNLLICDNCQHRKVTK